MQGRLSLRYSCPPPPPRSPSLFLVNLGNPNKTEQIQSAASSLLSRLASYPQEPGSSPTGPQNAIPFYARACKMVVAVGGGVRFSGGELCRAAEVLRQANADHPGQWQGKAEEAPPPHGRLQWTSQVANSFPRRPVSRRRTETPCALEYPFVSDSSFYLSCVKPFLGPSVSWAWGAIGIHFFPHLHVVKKMAICRDITS